MQKLSVALLLALCAAASALRAQTYTYSTISTLVYSPGGVAVDSAGAFKFTEGNKDSAMVVTLLPGNWTVQVSGANNGVPSANVRNLAAPSCYAGRR